MGKCEKLLEKAKSSPSNLSFSEICKLAECKGWVALKRKSGSHCMYENTKLDSTQGRLQNFQSENGKAKAYQVRQLLNAIENL